MLGRPLCKNNVGALVPRLVLGGKRMASTATTSAVLHRTIKTDPLQVVSANGNYVQFSNGQEMWDTTGGAGVACIGYNDKRVKQAMVEQIDKFSYTNSMFFGHPVGEKLAADLIRGTNGHMSKAYIMSSGVLVSVQALP